MGVRVWWLWVVLVGCGARQPERGAEAARPGPPAPDVEACSRDELSVVYCTREAAAVQPANSSDRLIVFVDPGGAAVAAWAAESGPDCTDSGEGCHEHYVLSRLGPGGAWSSLAYIPGSVHVVGWRSSPTPEAWALHGWPDPPESCYAMPPKPEGFDDYVWGLEPHIDPCGHFTFAGTLDSMAAFVRVESEAIAGVYPFGAHLWDDFAALHISASGRAVGLVRELPAPDPRNSAAPLGSGLWAAVLDPERGLSTPVRVTAGDEAYQGEATAAVDAAGNVLIGWHSSVAQTLADGAVEHRHRLATRLLPVGADPERDWEEPVLHHGVVTSSAVGCVIAVRAQDTGLQVEYTRCGDELASGRWSRRLDLDTGWGDPVEVIDPGPLVHREPEPQPDPEPAPGEYLLTLSNEDPPIDAQGPWPSLHLSRVDDAGRVRVLETLVSEPGGEISIRGGVIDDMGRTVLVWLEAEGPRNISESFGDCRPEALETCFTTVTYSHTRVYSVVVEPDGEARVVALPEMQRRPVEHGPFAN